MTADQDSLKRAVADAAVSEVEDGMLLGVGTGSTVEHFIRALGDSGIRLEGAVSSSEATTRSLERIGVDVLDLNAAGPLSLYIDGADEANALGQLIKGGGGALTREKIIAQAAERFVCICDASKRVGALGAFPLPVEVLPMARSLVGRALVLLGGQPVWREGFETDNGNPILDVHGLDLAEPIAMERRINDIPGVVCNGLFALRPADTLLFADANGVSRIDTR